MSDDLEQLLGSAAEALKNEQFPVAEELQRRACQLLRAQHADGARIAKELEKLADIHWIQHKYDLSVRGYQEVVEMLEPLVPANDFSVLRPLYRLAKARFEAQQYEDAEVDMRRAVSLTETCDDYSEGLAFGLYELGFLLYYVGKYREAEPFLLRALAVCEADSKIPEHYKIRTLSGIGLLYKFHEDLGKTPETYFQRVIEATRSDSGMRWTHLMNTFRLADYLAKCERYEEADEAYKQLLALCAGSLEPPESEVSAHVQSCIEYFKSRGREELVAHLDLRPDHHVYEQMVLERLKHAERTLAGDDPDLYSALLAAGNNALFEGNYDDAEALLLRGLDACEKVHGETSPQFVDVLNRICVARRRLDKFDTAESYVQRALKIAEEHFPDDFIYARTLETLAILREAQARTSEATEVYARAVAESEKICGFPSQTVTEVLYRQSGYLLRIGDLESGEKAIRRAISAMDDVEGLLDGEKADYLSTLVSILEPSGRHAEAEELRKRSKELFARAEKYGEQYG